MLFDQWRFKTSKNTATLIIPSNFFTSVIKSNPIHHFKLCSSESKSKNPNFSKSSTMSKSASSRLISGLRKLHTNSHYNTITQPQLQLQHHLLLRSKPLNPTPHFQFNRSPSNPNSSFSNLYPLGFARYFSFKSAPKDLGNKLTAGNAAKTVLDKPLSAVKSTFSRYREAVGLQINAFWRNNNLVLVGAGGVIMCAFLWRVMFGIANTFVGLSEGMAKYGFLALSASIVAFTGLYFRARIAINPDKVYRIAMTKLNTSAGILEVMGAPLTGTDLRAYVMSGGGLTLKDFKPTLRGKRCFLIFPIRGSERKGLVSVEVKKKKGQYDFKLLAVDIPMAAGPDQRLFLIGDEKEYKVGGGLIADLRDPVIKAMAATKEFEDLDQQEEEVDAEREIQEAERKHREELEKLEKEER